MSGHTRRTVLQWAAAALLATGCLSPTLPLPPPSPPDVTNVGVGQYRVQGSIPIPGAVLIRNARTRLIYGQADTQVFDIAVRAEPGDRMVLWYEVGSELSDPVLFEIEAPAVPLRDAGRD